jgi:Domain of unknown function (DUF6134)
MRGFSRLFWSGIVPAATAMGAIVVAAALASAAERRYTYRVDAPPYGDIGVYRTTVAKIGNVTTINTTVHLKVSLLGLGLYRLESSRTEREVGGRLVYFHGITTENGKSIEVDGRADGDRFIVTGPGGNVVAPGTIRTSDPWSAGVPGGDLIFMTDTGVVARVHTDGGEQTSITIDGKTMRVRRYRIVTADGRERYEVWLDDSRTPVMFDRMDGDGTVRFTLAQ